MQLVKEIADYYKIGFLTELHDEVLTQFKVIVISTPTFTHYEFFEKGITIKYSGDCLRKADN